MLRRSVFPRLFNFGEALTLFVGVFALRYQFLRRVATSLRAPFDPVDALWEIHSNGPPPFESLWFLDGSYVRKVTAFFPGVFAILFTRRCADTPLKCYAGYWLLLAFPLRMCISSTLSL